MLSDKGIIQMKIVLLDLFGLSSMRKKGLSFLVNMS